MGAGEVVGQAWTISACMVDGHILGLKQALDIRTNIALSQWYQYSCVHTGGWFFNHLQLSAPVCFCSHHHFKCPEGEDRQSAEHVSYGRLIEVIGWFFFDLHILGYVEDKDTGLSFHLPGGLGWLVYVEVPSRDVGMTPEETLEQFRGEIPTLGLLGSPHLIPNQTPYVIDSEVQLVCKYLKAYKERKIDRLYKNGGML